MIPQERDTSVVESLEAVGQEGSSAPTARGGCLPDAVTPPSTKRGVTFEGERVPNESGTKQISLDWITLTVVYDERLNLPAGIENTGEIVRPNPKGYNTTYQLSPAGTMSIHTDDPIRMKACFIFNGSALRELENHDITPESLLNHFQRLKGYNVTRCDIALDIKNAGLCAADIHHLNELAKQQDLGSSYNRKRHFHSSDAVVLTDSGSEVTIEACTLELGSRESDRFMRIYDKGAEQNTIEDWKRVEMEIKGKTALVLALEITLYGLEDVARGLFRSFINPPVFWWSWAIEGVWVVFRGAGRKVTNAAKWLHKQVKKTAQKVASSDDPLQRKLGEKFLVEIIEAMTPDRQLLLMAHIEGGFNADQKQRTRDARRLLGSGGQYLPDWYPVENL